MSSRVPRPQRQLRAPTATVRPRSVLSADHHARLAHRLTPRDRWLIRMLHEHHVLTTDTVTTMAFPSARSARQRLLELYQWDVIDRFQPLTRRGSAAMHYVLGGAGAAVLAAEEGVTTKALGYRRDDVLAVAHRHTLAHTVAINDFFARLVRRTITHHDVRLVAWWSETRCARYVGDLARPDAYGRITLPPPDTAAQPCRRPRLRRQSRIRRWSRVHSARGHRLRGRVGGLVRVVLRARLRHRTASPRRRETRGLHPARRRHRRDDPGVDLAAQPAT